ncbi:hypothetical protein [Actinomyces naeslundii]|uniref:Cyclophilin-like domain-containing protein n=1 Tax=Actinomyces naeslundii TaxID=1655 RepID=A0AA47FGD7_ACTNA|nr:hypothetical protein [Actinomyces naeslundii]WAL42863.1 hypothetical protein OFA60_12650 [Actinomyces naeslundii]
MDYCYSAACGTYDPLETHAGWRNGDISLAGGFAILFDGEEESAAYRNMMIIAHIDDGHLDLVKQFPADMKFTVEAA